MFKLNAAGKMIFIRSHNIIQKRPCVHMFVCTGAFFEFFNPKKIFLLLTNRNKYATIKKEYRLITKKRS